MEWTIDEFDWNVHALIDRQINHYRSIVKEEEHVIKSLESELAQHKSRKELAIAAIRKMEQDKTKVGTVISPTEIVRKGPSRSDPFVTFMNS